jgi:hypothetical protein
MVYKSVLQTNRQLIAGAIAQIGRALLERLDRSKQLARCLVDNLTLGVQTEAITQKLRNNLRSTL